MIKIPLLSDCYILNMGSSRYKDGTEYWGIHSFSKLDVPWHLAIIPLLSTGCFEKQLCCTRYINFCWFFFVVIV